MLVNLKRNVEELDEYDEGEVEVGVSGQRGRGEGHPEIGHAANVHRWRFILLILHRDWPEYAILAKQDPGNARQSC